MDLIDHPPTTDQAIRGVVARQRSRERLALLHAVHVPIERCAQVPFRRYRSRCFLPRHGLHSSHDQVRPDQVEPQDEGDGRARRGVHRGTGGHPEGLCILHVGFRVFDKAGKNYIASFVLHLTRLNLGDEI